MILEEKIEITVPNRNKSMYKKLGYDINKKKILIIIDDLSRNSQVKINTKCDICGKEKITTYQSYMNSYEKSNLYACSNKCGVIKSKLTCIKKYGVDNVSKSEEIKEKKKQTNIQNWGTENVFQNEKIKEKSKKTKKEKYNDEYYTNRKMCWETCMKNHGVKYPTQSKEILEKRNKNNLEKYSKEHFTQTKEYKNKVIKSNLEKYGVEWYLQSKDKKQKSIKTCLKKYGVEYPMQSEMIQNKMKETKINNGNYLPEEKIDDFIKYKRKVSSITKKNIKKLFDNWDGNDFYDNEYIKYNFSLKSTDKNYPTIDHKTSIYNGFKEKITPEIIGNINNLCITKMWINSSKGISNYWN